MSSFRRWSIGAGHMTFVWTGGQRSMRVVRAMDSPSPTAATSDHMIII